MVTTQEKIEAEAQIRLAELGGLRTRQDDIEFGKSWIIPQHFREDLDGAIGELQRFREAQYTDIVVSRTFEYRPYDVAASLERVLKRDFGAAFQKPSGLRPPQRPTVNVGRRGDTPITITVPWGDMAFPWNLGTITTGIVNDPKKGPLGALHIGLQRRFEHHAEGLLKMVQAELEGASIYMGKVFTGNQMNPDFLDVGLIDPSKFVYTEQAWAQVNMNVLSWLNDWPLLEKHGIAGKRVVVLEGPYGTGKTGFLLAAAKAAEHQGVTTIMCKPGEDDPFSVLQTAYLYSGKGKRVMVVIEDIDTYASVNDGDYTSRLLEAFDGFEKGRNILVVMTTNFIDRLQKGMTRSGRLDGLIHIGPMDRQGVERLGRMVLAGSLAEDVDFDAVYAATKGFTPAFVREAFDRSMRYAIATHGQVDKIGTEELVNACQGLYRQLELHEGASSDRPQLPPLDAQFRATIEDAVLRAIDPDILRSEIVSDVADNTHGTVRNLLDRTNVKTENDRGTKAEGVLKVTD